MYVCMLSFYVGDTRCKPTVQVYCTNWHDVCVYGPSNQQSFFLNFFYIFKKILFIFQDELT